MKQSFALFCLACLPVLGCSSEDPDTALRRVLVGTWTMYKSTDDLTFTCKFNADGTAALRASGNSLKGLAFSAMTAIVGDVREDWRVADMKIFMTYQGTSSDELNAFGKLVDMLSGSTRIGEVVSVSVARFDENQIVLSDGTVMRRLGVAPR